MEIPNRIMTKKITIGLFLLACWSYSSLGASRHEAAKIVYKTVVNGRTMERGSRPILMVGESFSASWSDKSGMKLIPQSPEEKEFIDYSAQKTWQVARLADGSVINYETTFSSYPEVTVTGETAEILGYRCTKATSVLRSNHIDIWFTRETGLRGTPQMAYGIPDGLVLKIVRNGNYEIVADSILLSKKRDDRPALPAALGEKVELPLYRHRVTESFVTTVDIFTDEQISWGNPIENPAPETPAVTFRYAGGTVILKKVQLPEVTPDYQVFAEVTQYSNGDAYDRTGSAFLVPTDKKQSFLDALRNGIDQVPAVKARNGKNYQGVAATPDFSPVVELVRFFTPFGVRGYNDKVEVYGQKWEDAAYYKQELTDLLPLLQGEAWLGVFIGNYDKGGHKVSWQLKYYPGSQQITDEKENQKWTLPLFNTLNIMEMAGQEYGTLFGTDSLTVAFEVPAGVKNLTLRYLTTGHGGWGGGDEFNQKVNKIFIDDQLVYSFVPWRSDCGAFRKYNPSSGNFWNGLSSSDYSRSGWCPGSATDPVYIPLENLSPGKHLLKVAIPLGQSEGGSFSAWNISGVLTGEFE